MYTAMWSRSSHSTSVTCSNKKSTRRIEGRAVWMDAGRGGRADRDRRIRARNVAAGKEGRQAGGRARPLNSEGNIFWGVVVVVVRLSFHGTTERRVTLFSILSFFFSLPVSLCVSVAFPSLTPLLRMGQHRESQFHSGPACDGARSKADQSPKSLSRAGRAPCMTKTGRSLHVHPYS